MISLIVENLGKVGRSSYTAGHAGGLVRHLVSTELLQDVATCLTEDCFGGSRFTISASSADGSDL